MFPLQILARPKQAELSKNRLDKYRGYNVDTNPVADACSNGLGGNSWRWCGAAFPHPELILGGLGMLSKLLRLCLLITGLVV